MSSTSINIQLLPCEIPQKNGLFVIYTKECTLTSFSVTSIEFILGTIHFINS